MADMLGNLTAFNVGIERVFTSGAAEAQSSRLPEGVPSPSAHVPQQHLERAITSPALDNSLLNALRSAPNDPALLMPSRFNPVLRSLAAKLRERKRRRGDDRRGGGKRDDRSAREERLERLAELLDEDESLRDLLSAYRGLLLGG
ncbi:MAG: hypothetical protein H0S85_03050 [Desulfovibrionaceae bacterium]|jgi:hypothetical protein|nr:hypothetical protein [Desulfovibrionaceae bacterium]